MRTSPEDIRRFDRCSLSLLPPPVQMPLILLRHRLDADIMLVAAHQNSRAEEMGPQAVSGRRDSASSTTRQLSKSALNFTLADL